MFHPYMQTHLTEDGFVDELKECLLSNFESYKLSDTVNKRSLLVDLLKKSASDCQLNGKVCAVMTLVEPDSLIVLHAGDCRAYLPDRKIKTNDHSIAQETTDRYKSHEYLAAHPLKNHVTKTISKDLQSYSISEFSPLSNGERLLLCSDGWWRNNPIENIWGVSEVSLKQTVDIAVESRVDNDNVTVMLYRQPSKKSYGGESTSTISKASTKG